METVNIKQEHWLSAHIPGIILFIIALLVALVTYQNYGAAFDEILQRDIGLVNYRYIFEGDNALLSSGEKDHGAGFDLLLIIAEKAMKLSDMRDILLMRHLVTHIYFLIAAFFFYALTQQLLKNRVVSCFAFLLLLLNPRIYAHSFFNGKDVPFLSTIIIVLFLAHLAFSGKKIFLFLLLGFACGYATSIRITGILPVAFLSALFCYDMVIGIIKGEKVYRTILSFVVFLAGFSVLLYVAWPALWRTPFKSFFESFQSLAHYIWNLPVMFAGTSYPGSELPRYYLPVWFCITVPVVFLIAGLIGFILVLINLFRNPAAYVQNTPGRNLILYTVCFAGPFLAIIVLDSVVYDDWRHVYFVYPPFVLLAIYVLHRAYFTRYKMLVLGTFSIQAALVLFFFIRNHPNQNVYFNSLVSHKKEFLRKSYDLDYWGLSHKQALEHILDTDKSPQIKVLSTYPPVLNDAVYLPVLNNWRMLPEDQRSRIVLTPDTSEAKYFLTTFRYHPEDYEHQNIYHEIKVLNSTVIRIYKLREN